MLGITIYYLDEYLKVRNVLLGLKLIYGAYSGVVIIKEILGYYTRVQS